MSELGALLDAGRLDDAVERTAAKLRTAPGDHAARTLLAELLCLNGAFERAEAQLAIVAQQDVSRPVAIARMRHLIRAAVGREAWFANGAVPALVAAPTSLQRIAIELALALREGDAARVEGLLGAAEDARPKLSGTADGTAFDDWRDVDDRSAWFLEVFSHDGGYLWVDPTSIAGLKFTPASRPIDLLWREARMTLHDGRVAEIVVPAQYPGIAADEEQRLARRTDWQEEPGGAWTGTGQRLWLLGDEAHGVLGLGEIAFEAAP